MLCEKWDIQLKYIIIIEQTPAPRIPIIIVLMLLFRLKFTPTKNYSKCYWIWITFCLVCIHRAILYYLTTTISAVVLGIILVTTIRPGVIGGDNSLTANKTDKVDQKRVYTPDTLLDLIR